jgi:hypothetical protein
VNLSVSRFVICTKIPMKIIRAIRTYTLLLQTDITYTIHDSSVINSEDVGES